MLITRASKECPSYKMRVVIIIFFDHKMVSRGGPSDSRDRCDFTFTWSDRARRLPIDSLTDVFALLSVLVLFSIKRVISEARGHAVMSLVIKIHPNSIL